MSIITRYFSTTGAGSADGTSWANRAPLFSAGNWSSVITGFSFAGADSLECRIEGALTYTCNQSLASGLFANPPTVANSLFLHGCDSSGNLLSPPDGDWVSPMPAWDYSSLPLINMTANNIVVSVANSFSRLLAITSSVRTGVLHGGAAIDWCYIENSNSSTSVSCTSSAVTNCVLRCSGTSYDSCISTPGGVVFNCRLIGNSSASSGARRAVNTSAVGYSPVRCTAIDHPGGAFVGPAGATTRFMTAQNNTIYNCGTFGFLGNGTAGQTVYHSYYGNVIVGCTTGIDASAARVWAVTNRLRNNTADFANMANFPTDRNETAAGTDADEFVNVAGGDFRVKAGSAIWGRGFGAGDQPAASGMIHRPGQAGGFNG